MRYMNESWIQGSPAEEAADAADRRARWLWVPWVVVILGTVWLLAGCAEHFAANDDRDCRSYGYTPGTDGYAQCRQERANLRAAYMQGLSGNMMSSGTAIYTAPAATTRPTTTSCQKLYNGQIVCTTN